MKRRSRPWRKTRAAAMGVPAQTFCRWKATFGGLRIHGVWQRRYLEEQDRKRKQLLAEATPDNRTLRELPAKCW